jgi:hypothetical protein
MKLDPNKLKTRNQLMVALINGVTKSGVQKDQRKEADKKACRRKVRRDDE